MLKLKHTHHLTLPHLNLSSRPMQLSPVTTDNDELTQAIDADIQTHDDVWQLSERPDANELNQFWEEVVEDVSKDPKWFRFENE